MSSAPKPAPPRLRLFTTAAERRKFLVVSGQSGRGVEDVYHLLIGSSWLSLFLWVAGAYLALNAGFGLVYYVIGGVENVREGSYLDDFFFSVHTLATIGYGSMYPKSNAAEAVVTLEAMIGIIYSALITGLAFAKFARPTSRALWAKKAVIHDREGVPTLMFRIANERMNHIIDAEARVALVRDETNKDGERLRRGQPLELVRSHTQSFALTWSVMHQIDERSPFWGSTPESLAAQNAELAVTVNGRDETLMQTVHTHHSFTCDEILFATRYVDIIVHRTDGKREMALGRFHDVQPAKLTWKKMGVDREPSTA